MNNLTSLPLPKPSSNDFMPHPDDAQFNPPPTDMAWQMNRMFVAYYSQDADKRSCLLSYDSGDQMFTTLHNDSDGEPFEQEYYWRQDNGVPFRPWRPLNDSRDRRTLDAALKECESL